MSTIVQEKTVYRDLREWIARLEQEDLIRRVTAEVDWDEEIGAIASRVMHRGGPALLFENIKDYQTADCQQLFTNSLGSYPRLALALGLPKETLLKELIAVYRARTRQRVPPVAVNGGPVKEVILKGEAANLLALPIPKWTGHDGGRFITFGSFASRDPENGRHNLGIYRGHVLDERTIGFFSAPDKHLMRHYAKYKQLGQDMPVAIVIGGQPLLPLCSSTSFPFHVSEYDVLGALGQQAVNVTRCELSDLEVPADAEIIIEGVVPIDPSRYRMEGPFAEFTGYYGSDASLKPVVEVQCITRRRHPIYQGTLRAKPVDEGHVMDSLTGTVHAWEALETIGVPGILDVFTPPCACLTNVRVQIKKMYQGHAKQVAAALWALHPAHFKNVIVVEEDIDIHDPAALEWAFAYRVDAKEDGIVIFPGTPGSALDPSTDPRWKDTLIHGRARWNRVLIDATKEWRWGPKDEWGGDRYPPIAQPTPEMREQVERRWKEFGL